MKKLLALTILLVACNDTYLASKPNQCPNITVKFSPRGGITQSIVDGIDSSKKEIRIQAFSFTSVPIADALVRAREQNKNIEVVLDQENLHNKNSVLNTLYRNGISIYIDDRHAIAHNKIVIIDDNKVFTGSFNFSKGAEEHNAENSILIQNIKITSLYLENYNLHKEHSYQYSPDK